MQESSIKSPKDEKNDKRTSRRRNLLPVHLSIAVGLVAYAVYLLTLSPGVSWEHHSEDSGDLITAAWVLGIPHPTGYPLFCLLGWLWSHLLPLGSVAWRMNAFSAMWGALAAGVTLRGVWRSFDLLPENTLFRITRSGRAIAAVASGLILAFAEYVWQQSVITEVYTLGLFLTSLVGWILIELLVGAKEIEADPAPDRLGLWDKRRAKLIALLALSWGLALTNHLTSVFLLPSILLVLVFGRVNPAGKELAKGIGWLVLPLLLYLYLPIRSLMNPPLDWGNPQDLDSFIWVVTGRQFKEQMFNLLPYMMLHQVMKYSSVPMALGFLGALAAGMGVCRLLLAKSGRVLILLGYTLLLMASNFFYLSSYYIWDPEGYLLPSTWAISLWAGWSIVLLVNVPVRWIGLGRAAGIILLILAPIGALVGNWSEADLSGNRDAIRYGEEAFQAFEPNAIVLELRYERAFALWYYREVEYADERDDVAVVFAEHASFDWGLDLLRRKYPDIVFPDTPLQGSEADARTAAWIIQRNIMSRPIYSGADITVFEDLEDEGYRFEAVGLMFRVYPPEPEQEENENDET